MPPGFHPIQFTLQTHTHTHAGEEGKEGTAGRERTQKRWREEMNEVSDSIIGMSKHINMQNKWDLNNVN